MFIVTVGRGKKCRAYSFGFGSVNKQTHELMCVAKYVKSTSRYMVDVAHVAHNITPIPRDEKEEA